MKTIELGLIQVSKNRQRRDFDAAKMHEFSDGIAKRGLFHPIVLRESEGTFTLVAGERRLRAVTDLADLGAAIKHDGQPVPLGYIPYTLMEDLDELAYEEAELEENTHRVDLSWQERAAAVARLSALRNKQAAADGRVQPTVAEIALEVRGTADGVNHETTRRELIVARHLDDPTIAGAKNVDDAFKILRKQEASAKNRELGASVGRTFTADLHRVLNEDSLTWMQGAEGGQFDCILTDPPYGMGADDFGDSGGIGSLGIGATGQEAGAHTYEDSAENALRCYSVLAQESFRLCKEQAHLYAFCDIEKFLILKDFFSEAGWTVFRTPLIWYKKSGARAPWPEQGPQRKYECLLYAVKGKRPVLRMAGDVLDFGPDSNLGHAAQKPVALYQELLSRSCLPGQSVFDPFCGTGPIFPAAHALKVRAVGIEMDQASFGIAVKRIESLKSQMELDLALEV